MISEQSISRIKKFFLFLTLSDMTEANVSERLLVQYRCSSCGAENKAKTRLKQTCTSSTAFSGLTNSDFWLRKNVAETQAEIHAINRYMKKKTTVQNGSTAKAARTARLHCSCKRCGHREPWARMDYRFVPATALIALVPLFLCLLLCAVFSALLDCSVILYLLAGYAACVMLAAAAEWLLYVIRSVQIKRLPQESLPSFEFTES